MDFAQDDIKRLYGSHFFILPETEAVIEAEEEMVEKVEHKEEPANSAPVKVEEKPVEADSSSTEPAEVSNEVPEVAPSPYHKYFMQGEAVEWKMKPQTQLALILQNSEFRNRDLTNSLKGYIVDAGIPTDNIGFGVIPDEAEMVDCSEMKPRVAMVFKLFKEKLPSPVEINGKSMFAVADLTLLGSKPAFQKRLVQILQQAYQLTQS